MDLWPRETSMQQASDNGVQLWTSGTKTSPLAWTDIDTSWSPSWESRNRCLYVYRQQLSLLSPYIYITINFIAKFIRKLIAHCPIKRIFMKAFINLFLKFVDIPCRNQKRNRDIVILHWKTKFWIRLPKNWQRKNADLPGRESKTQFIQNWGPSKSTYQSLPPWDSDIQIHD